jgi:hypothetical protein
VNGSPLNKNDVDRRLRCCIFPYLVAGLYNISFVYTVVNSTMQYDFLMGNRDKSMSLATSYSQDVGAKMQLLIFKAKQSSFVKLIFGCLNLVDVFVVSCQIRLF